MSPQTDCGEHQIKNCVGGFELAFLHRDTTVSLDFTIRGLTKPLTGCSEAFPGKLLLRKP